MPNCVCTYLLFTTREMVETSSPVRSAISLRIIGRSFDWSPVLKYSCWKSSISCMVRISVSRRCLIAEMNHLAESILFLTNCTASRFFSCTRPSDDTMSRIIST